MLTLNVLNGILALLPLLTEAKIGICQLWSSHHASDQAEKGRTKFNEIYCKCHVPLVLRLWNQKLRQLDRDQNKLEVKRRRLWV